MAATLSEADAVAIALNELSKCYLNEDGNSNSLNSIFKFIHEKKMRSEDSLTKSYMNQQIYHNKSDDKNKSEWIEEWKKGGATDKTFDKLGKLKMSYDRNVLNQWNVLTVKDPPDWFVDKMMSKQKENLLANLIYHVNKAARTGWTTKFELVYNKYKEKRNIKLAMTRGEVLPESFEEVLKEVIDKTK
jgi:hypothetical protein